jgi:endoplasmic reticulum Man9GlcNAc2 1,2-alpha-mannosidase
MLLLISGVTYLFLMNKSAPNFVSNLVLNSIFSESSEAVYQKPPRLWRRPPRLTPQLTPDEMNKKGSSSDHSKWVSRQQKVKEAFNHAWSGYKNFAMGFDELMPVCKKRC